MKLDVEHKWLSPSEALGRQIPFESIPFSDSYIEKTKTRYGFHIGQYGLLIEEELVSEVLDASEIFSFPKSPAWLVGMTNIRGNIVPVLDLKNILGVSSERYTKENILILGKGNETAGLLIDGLSHSITVTTKPSQLPKLNEIVAQYFKIGFTSDQVDWLEFDYKGLFRHLVENNAKPELGQY